MANASKRDRIIKQWMLTVNSDGGLLRNDDLHIDQIDDEWVAKQTWLNAGLEAHRIALEVRKVNHLDVQVVLAFSLTQDPEFPFRNRYELEAALDWSPPSLYVFKSGEEPWHQPGCIRVEQFDLSVFGGLYAAGSAFYVEFRQPDNDEIYRSFFIGG